MHITRITAADAVEYRALMLHAYQHAADSFTYAELKRRLAAENHGETLASRERHSLAKTGFVQDILPRAGFVWSDRP